MKLKELSQRGGVPIPTIKYYLREGLLPKGDPLGETKADYGDHHLDRLRIIRSLVEIGEVPIAVIRQILAAVDDETVPATVLLATALSALGAGPSSDAAPAGDRTGAESLIAGQGWQVSPGSTAPDQLAAALGALRLVGLPADAAQLAPYTRAALEMAGHQLPLLPDPARREEFAARAVIGAVLYDRLLLALLRLAKENISMRRDGH
ncbi:MerR family transcriptional regulator [Amycolatopsis sp. lyj-84]|uniref:MerR family transcriptional regulator n=1 Tax=Amycolatopsis sp. lyj-84 TaxID=2789284 RepID=UPI00397D1775